ncbi:Protein kinase family protein with ARM repeat domain [Abeliophyllum distichum]|uniref:Protein kinase family protein with ARM repeat domain n=1 Tax=Abeliophyllum distichum TaxID=126358 RepID=A0ABD1UP56_9LAMI
MLKFLKGVVGGSGAGLKDLPYNIGEPYSSAWGSWVHCRGTSKDDGTPVSIFSLSGSNANDGHLAAGRNGVKRLRTVRHPNILSFLYSTEAETFDGSNTKITIYIVTEPVTPLSEKIKELGLEGSQRDEYYAWGLHRIAKAVSFLNNDCKLVHGNVCMASVVVTQTLDWKLHAFDVLSEFDGNNEASAGPMLLSKTEELRNTASIPKSLLPDYQRLLSSMPSRRLNSSKLLENSVLKRILFSVSFQILPEQLPRQIVLKKLLPLLASALEFGSAAAPALTALLKMGSWLSAEDFSLKVLPTVVKLFASNDRAIRVGLLQHIDQYGESLSSQVVDEQDNGIVVKPNVRLSRFTLMLLLGFLTHLLFLRELTLKSMLVLAPKLSQRTISGSLLKFLSKLQVDEEPAIRTNTTILLGNIASYLNEGMRKRVLINAFTVRALRDTFSPARGAGIMALCATSSYYDVTEIATRILPNLVVLTIDPDSDVRSKACQAVDQFLQIVKQYHEKTSTEDPTGASSFGISSIPGNASLLGWAMSSLTLKGGKPSEPSVLSSSSASAPLASSISNASSVLDGANVPAVRVSSSTDLTDQPAPVSPTSSTDGWGELENGIHEDDGGDKDGWDDVEPLEASKPSSALANIQAAQKRPVSQPKPQVTSSRPKSTLKTSKDEDNDLWGSTADPTPKSTSKPSYSKSSIVDDDDPWGAIAAPVPKPSSKPMNLKSGGSADD